MRHEEIFWGDVNILQPGRFGLNSCISFVKSQ